MVDSLRFADVSVSYRSKLVLDELSWEIGPGITGLLGPNGAGKSTLLHVALGMVRPRAGRVEMQVAGRQARVGFLPQRFSLAAEMTVRDTVAYTAWVNGVGSKECGKAADAAIDLVDLGDHRASRVRSLSGGQRQRVGIAAALAHNPEILILDEPTVGLDPGQRLRVRELIANVAGGRVVLLSTHLVEDIVHLCDQVAVITQGKIRFTGTPQSLEAMIDEDETTQTVFGSPFERAYNGLITSLGVVSD
ncbi:MAG TPA: ATP-binding cassette domain-containing protein [Aeromicrobium sp.]|nr:ATP-binding cassette domain-containing protein [Aeromicrobium sp.]